MLELLPHDMVFLGTSCIFYPDETIYAYAGELRVGHA
jgi:hypothetical protein